MSAPRCNVGRMHEVVAQRVAKRYVRPELPYDDALQEARYAIWRETERRGELTEGQAYLVAKNRVLRVLEQRPLGSERPVGRPPGRNGVKPVKTVLTFDGVIYDDQAPVVPDFADEVILRVDVERALEKLTELEERVVRALYWDNLSWRQARLELGFTPQAYWSSARDKLRASLGA